MDKDIQKEIDELEGVVIDTNDSDAKNIEQDTKEEESELDADEKDAGQETGNIAKSEDEQDESDESLEQAEDTPKRLSIVDLIALKKKRIKNLKLALIIPAILIVIAGMVTLLFIVERNRRYDNLLNVDYFYEGVYVDDIALGGLTLEDATQKVEDALKEKIDQVKVVLIWSEEEKVTFDKSEMDISLNSEKIIEKAWNEGRSGTDKERYDYVLNLAQNPVYYSVDMSVDPSRIEAKVKAVAYFRQRDPGEASVRFDPDPEKEGSEWFDYTEPETGIKTDPDALWADVVSAVKIDNAAEIEIDKTEIEPSITLDDLKGLTQLITQFKSHMAKSTNREHNVRLACSMINGTVVMPGEIFSFNDTTGRRTKAAGFKEANVIVGGNQLVPGVAGGVCQVSGTLFNAVVRADLEVVERQHHSFELSYLTRGRDATVNYGSADLRFKNNTDNPIYISMYTIGREVYAEIYGEPLADGMTIELYVKTTQTIDPGFPVYVEDSTVPFGQTETYSARTGIKCTTYKDYYDENGKLVDRVELHRDYYRPFAKEIHYHPGAGVPNP